MLEAGMRDLEIQEELLIKDNLALGDTVLVQNQLGNNPRRWEKCGYLSSQAKVSWVSQAYWRGHGPRCCVTLDT